MQEQFKQANQKQVTVDLLNQELNILKDNTDIVAQNQKILHQAVSKIGEPAYQQNSQMLMEQNK